MSNILNEIFAHPYRDPSAIAPPINAEEFDKVIFSRRSVRKFTDKKIPPEIMNRIFAAALLAPNSSNLQPWEFYWIRNADMKIKLIPIFLDQQAIKTSTEFVIAVARTKTWKRNAQIMLKTLGEMPQSPQLVFDYYKKIVPLAYTIGFFGILGFLKKILLSTMGLFKPTPRECTSKSDLQIWAVKSTALACENLMLAARAYGFDSCPMEGYDSKRLKKVLKLPSDAVPVMGLALGERSKEGIYGPQIRFNANLFIHEV